MKAAVILFDYTTQDYVRTVDGSLRLFNTKGLAAQYIQRHSEHRYGYRAILKGGSENNGYGKA